MEDFGLPPRCQGGLGHGEDAVLLQLLERVRQAMIGVIQALWPAFSLPEGLGELGEKLEAVRQRFHLWKISACRQGAREAWAMVKTRYPKALESLQRSFREHSGASGYGRYQPAVRAPGMPGPL